MPWRFAGLWSGARRAHFAIAFFAAAVTFAGSANMAAPCTTRWPIASISARDFTTPHAGSHRTDITAPIAATWSLSGISRTIFPHPVFV